LQRDVLLSAAPRLLLNATRQSGKSTVAALKAAWTVLQGGLAVVVCWQNSRRVFSRSFGAVSIDRASGFFGFRNNLSRGLGAFLSGHDANYALSGPEWERRAGARQRRNVGTSRHVVQTHGPGGMPMKIISAAAIAFAVVLSSIGGLYPTPAQAQPSIQIGPGGVRVEDERDRRLRRRRDVCEELRAACLNKDRLGEQGEGNCRRYRQTCR